MKKTTLDIKSIVSCGASVILDAKKYTTLDLKAIASLCTNGNTITIKNASSKTTLELKALAEFENVILDLT